MRRYRILFIDDEEVIRESFIKLVDWEKHQFDVAGVFRDGESAWEYLTEHSVDIIVTDINMPFMNGISLLENIRRESPKTRVLLLTGYEYFEYAHKAVQLKAFDFLLKPITTERLLCSVENAAFDIEKEEATQEAVGKSLELTQSDFVNQLLYEKIHKDEIKNKASALQVPTEAGSYLVLLAAVDALEGDQFPEEEIEEIKREIQEKIREKKTDIEKAAGAAFQIYFGRNIGNYIQMLLIADKGEPFTDYFIQIFSENLMGIRKDSANYQMTLAVGRNRQRMEELPESFKKVLHVLKNRHILGVGKTLYSSDAVSEGKAAEKIVLPTDTFLHHIRMGLVQEVEEDIRKIYEAFKHKEYLTLESARMVTTELAITAFKGEIASRDESVSYLYYLNHIQQLNTLDEMEQNITQFAVQIAEKRKKSGNHKKTIAEQALEFLKHNYEIEDLSLNDVAAFLNISVSYLAVLFKQETDRNFSAHLLGIRMEKAKELLKKTGFTVSEISEKVGYGSSQYFAVCFKKYTGISPGAWRDQA